MTLAARVKASRRIDRLETPLLVLLAEEEKIVDNRPAAALAERAPKGRSVTIKGAYHEILMETDERRAEALAAFDALLAELRATGVLAAAKPSRARPAGGPKGAGAGKPGPTLKEKKASAAAKTRP
jgi:lysophospholipase